MGNEDPVDLTEGEVSTRDFDSNDNLTERLGLNVSDDSDDEKNERNCSFKTF